MPNAAATHRPRGTGTKAPELLRLVDIEAGYGGLQVLWNVDLVLQTGEYVAVLGANGAGKSTLLKVVAGLLRPTRGEVILDGTAITSLGAARRAGLGIALAPEGRGLFTGMTVKENLIMGAYARPRGPEVARDLEWVLGLFPDLGGKLRRIAGSLSGGEQQMCAIGRALMGRPRLLLIDELSFGLAPKLADHLLEALGMINRAGTAILLVEQDALAALRGATRAYVVADGRVVKSGQSADFLADPAIQRSYLGG
jgi:branched-chain amino acid transport system ATP-binding protein